MSQPFVGEVRLVGFNFAPVDWLACQGQLLPISQYDTLFNLIGTIYGGDGQNTFGLPNLQGRTPIHQGSNGVNSYVIGQMGGQETVTITPNQYPQHTHAFRASSNSTSLLNNPDKATVGAGVTVYSATPPAAALSSLTLGNAQGGGQPHDNMQPYLTLNWVISLYGIFPSQN